LHRLFSGDFKLIMHYFPHRTITALKLRFHKIKPNEKVRSLISRSTHDIQESMKTVTNTILRTFHDMNSRQKHHDTNEYEELENFNEIAETYDECATTNLSSLLSNLRPAFRLLLTSFCILLILIFQNDGTFNSFKMNLRNIAITLWVSFFEEVLSYDLTYFLHALYVALFQIQL